MDITRQHNKYMEEKHGKYPYLDVEQKWLTRARQAFSHVNPFALEQFSSKDRLTFSTFRSGSYYMPESLPNPIKYSSFLPPHYDPYGEEAPGFTNWRGIRENPTTAAVFDFTPATIPLVCTRYLGYYDRCVMINGHQKCKEEENNFLAICPNFALEIYRDSKIWRQKVRMIQRNEYQEAMKIAPYNVGRSVAEVSESKRYKDGQAPNLRPDSIWNDDRYVDVTQQDIDEAKKRRAAYLKSIGHNESDSHTHKPHEKH